ncbi:MAG: 50S ribosomal protein L29 [Nanoarchaeales archaeon]|nr:50S ribosomal protein L29 [Nanoarchaeales archaeon]
MKKLDLMNMKFDDLAKKLEELKKDLFNLRSASLAGEDSMKKKAKIAAIKKDVARILTRINNK